jgi:SAM-dependent methyltransferase
VTASGWVWDETLYAGSAAYYAAGRRPYPREVAPALRAALDLDGTGRLLDVGCGPGSLTLHLAPMFASVVGVDADPGMLAEAVRQAATAGITNARWRRMRAEELPGGLGRFHVVTFAQSFHWFDRTLVAGRVKAMLESGGACVLVHATTHEGVPGEDTLHLPRPPWNEVAALVVRYLGTARRAGRGVLPGGTPSDEDDVMRAAGFVGPTRVEVGGGTVWERSEDEVVAAVFSLSRSTPHLFGGAKDDFERDLRLLLRRTSPDGRFAERAREVALDIWRPQEPAGQQRDE